MDRKIRITVGELALGASLTDSATADAIWEALPLDASVNTWGDEFYFDIGVPAELEPDARDVVEVGTLAFWPPGQAFCIFFGPTPASQGDEVRAASVVNEIGALDEVPVTELREISSGTPIRIERDV